MKEFGVGHDPDGNVSIAFADGEEAVTVEMGWRFAVQFAHQILVTAFYASCHIEESGTYSVYAKSVQDQITAQMKEVHDAHAE